MELEVCVSSIEDVIVAEKAGATRIELCTAMEVIGITPTLSNYILAKKLTHLPILAFIRPRAGGFNYTDLEFEVMQEDARNFHDAGARDFVFGILTPDRKIDVKRCKLMMDQLPNSRFIFHKAFDYVDDFDSSMEALIHLGFSRVLTSGGPKDTLSNLEVLKYLIDKYRDKIEIMPGGGITLENLDQVLDALDVKSVHLSCKRWKKDTIDYIETDYEHLKQVALRIKERSNL